MRGTRVSGHGKIVIAWPRSKAVAETETEMVEVEQARWRDRVSGRVIVHHQPAQ